MISSTGLSGVHEQPFILGYLLLLSVFWSVGLLGAWRAFSAVGSTIFSCVSPTLFTRFQTLFLAMVFVTIFGPGLTNALVALSLVGWTAYARIFRGDILRTKQLEFVDGAQALGAKRRRIFGKHILPNSLGSLIIVASLDIGAVVLISATLSFLGLGAEEGFADWGQLVNFARDTLLGSPGKPFVFWYTYVWPSIAIALLFWGGTF